MRDTNVKMWMKFSFSERDVSDNEMDKRNTGNIKSGCGIGEKCEEISLLSRLEIIGPEKARI